jgi:putative transposase
LCQEPTFSAYSRPVSHTWDRRFPYLNAFETGSEARRGIGRWINYYNGDRPHSSHNGLTPNEADETNWKGEKLAA